MRDFAKMVFAIMVVVLLIGLIGYIFNSSRIDEAYNKNIQIEYAKSQNTTYLIK